jgi:CxxC motif-containing protein (DUF1111 family)
MSSRTLFRSHRFSVRSPMALQVLSLFVVPVLTVSLLAHGLQQGPNERQSQDQGQGRNQSQGQGQQGQGQQGPGSNQGPSSDQDPGGAAHDPGVRGEKVDAGGPLASVSADPNAAAFFANGLVRFQETESVNGGNNNGLGPRFNSNSCSSCHAQPTTGGTSPSASVYPNIGPNPETVVFNLLGAHNALPSFITADGPVREARFKFMLTGDGSLSSTPDGGVHDLFVITGRSDAGGCQISQPAFERNLALDNVIFRIPTPLFGVGLIESITDNTILSNLKSNAAQKGELGITGHPNFNGNDGTISRFGWKAQNRSLLVFSGEAYNVEMGVTNELFPNERPSPDEEVLGGLPANCLTNKTPEDSTNFTVGTSSSDAGRNAQVPSDIVEFAVFMRFLAPPTASTTTPGGAGSIASGRSLFTSVGCAHCHTPELPTGPSSLTADLSHATARLFSDLVVHRMGALLADGVSQGGAGPDEFRTAPLWGLGQRIHFLHDGRTMDLLDAIRQHAGPGSEAEQVVDRFQALTSKQQQDLLNFLRSL